MHDECLKKCRTRMLWLTVMQPNLQKPFSFRSLKYIFRTNSTKDWWHDENIVWRLYFYTVLYCVGW